MNIVAIIQARMGSTRLPGKVLRPLMGKPMLWHIVNRLRYVRGLHDVVVATPDAPADRVIVQFCKDNNIACFAGSENDVLDRYYQADLIHKGDPLLRITGDCPLVDPELVTRLIKFYLSGQYDHVGVAAGAVAIYLETGRFPSGLDAECFSFSALEKAWREAKTKSDREHVTPYIWRNKDIFRCASLMAKANYADLRWSVDTEADFKLISIIYQALYREGGIFLMKDILDYLAQHPELSEINREFIGREKYEEVWKK